MPREALRPALEEVASKRWLETQPQRRRPAVVEARSDRDDDIQKTAHVVAFEEVVEDFARAGARDGTMRHEEAHESEVGRRALGADGRAQPPDGRRPPYGETRDDAVPDEVDDPARHVVGLEILKDAAGRQAALSEPTRVQTALELQDESCS